MKLWRTICLMVFVSGLLLSVYAESWPYYQDIKEKSFSVKEGGSLIIDSNLGDLDIKGEGSNKVEIEILRRVKTMNEREANDILNDLEMEIEQSGNDVRIYVRYKYNHGFSFSNHRYPRLKFTISVPEKYNLDLKTGDGDVRINHIEGEVDCRTSDGDILSQYIKGPMILKTSDGDVYAKNIQGKVDAKTSDGDIDMDDVTDDILTYTSDGDIKANNIGGSVEAKTSDGDIHIRSAEGSVILKTSDGDITVDSFKGFVDASTSDGDIVVNILTSPEKDSRLATSDGSIRVYMARDVKLTVDANARDGRVKTDFPITVSDYYGKHQLQSEINGGGSQLYIRCSDADILLSQK